MAKGNSSRGSSGGGRGGGSRGSNGRTSGPMIPKSAVTKHRSKYGEGGKVNK